MGSLKEKEVVDSASIDNSAEIRESFEKQAAVERVATPSDSEKRPENALSRHTSRTSAREVLDDVKRTLSGADEEDGIVYPKKWKLFLIMVALCLSVFLMALDNTIISVAIPKIVSFRAFLAPGWLLTRTSDGSLQVSR